MGIKDNGEWRFDYSFEESDTWLRQGITGGSPGELERTQHVPDR